MNSIMPLTRSGRILLQCCHPNYLLKKNLTVSASFVQHIFCQDQHRESSIQQHPLVARHLSSHDQSINKKSIFQILLDPAEHVKRAPRSLQPYLRLMRYDKPAGVFVIWYPAMWSLCMATPAAATGTGALWPDPYLMLIFTAGSYLMRCSGCIINDLWDKDYDKKVERTKHRPLCSGELSGMQALGCLAVCLGASAGLLVQLNEYTMVLGALSLIPVTIYPLLKRYTYYPQLGLGITLNWGVLMASSAVNGYCDWSVALPLYLGCVCWTMYYDTIYAHQDKDDDHLVGVKSMALMFGENTKTFLALFSCGSISLWTWAGANADLALPYFAGLTYFSAHFIYQLRDLDIDDPEQCWVMFRMQKIAGGVLLAACFLTLYFQSSENLEDEDCTSLDDYVYKYIMKSMKSALISAYVFTRSKLHSHTEDAAAVPMAVTQTAATDVNDISPAENSSAEPQQDVEEFGLTSDESHADTLDLPETPEFCDVEGEHGPVLKKSEIILDTRSPSPLSVNFQASEKRHIDELVDKSSRIKH